MPEQNQTEQGAGAHSNVSASIEWLLSIATLVTSVARLGVAEISLAREDLGRLVFVCTLLVPMLLLTWIAFGVLISWIAFELTLSAIVGFATFAVIQLVVSLILLSKFKIYQHNLTLPATRAQISAIYREVRDETTKQTYPDRKA